MKKLAWILVVVVIGAIAAIVRAALLRPDTRAESAPAVVRVKRRAPEPVVKASGVIKPMIGAEARVGARVSGIVQRLYVRIGDVVEKGQLLAELDDRELIARRNQATASLNLAEANRSYARAEQARMRNERIGFVFQPGGDLTPPPRTAAGTRPSRPCSQFAETRLILSPTNFEDLRLIGARTSD